MRSAPVVCLIAGMLLAAGRLSHAEGDAWPAWRGKAGRGVSQETNLPTKWSAKDGIQWRAELPGRGNSSPAVIGNRLYLTTQLNDRSLWVMAVNRQDGRIVWKRKVGRGTLSAFGPSELYEHRHNAATPSPVADENHVWAYFGTGQLVCFDHSGTLEWKRDLTEGNGRYRIRFGMASSPRLGDDHLYLICLHQGPSYVLALDQDTGQRVWKTRRTVPEATAPPQEDGEDAYSSPVIHQTKQGTEVLVSGEGHIDAYHPKTGKQLWISAGLVSDDDYGRILTSPAIGRDVIVACSSNPSGGGQAIALKSGGSGEITKSHRLWTYQPFSPDAPTPVCYRGRVYMVRDDGVGSCLDAQTGKSHWRKRLGGETYRSSVIAGDQKVYFLSLHGTCTVVQAGPEGQILARNELPGTFFATPAISDGHIYLRGHHRLYAIGP